MNLYLRFIILLIKRYFHCPPAGFLEATKTSYRIHLPDLDFNMHVNNARYLAIMDLGRFDLLLRAGIFWKFTFDGYFPVVGSESIRFRKSLHLFEKFDLITQIECWDDKDLYISHKIYRGDDFVAEGYVKGRFKRRGQGSVSTKELFELLGEEYPGSTADDRAKLQLALEQKLAQTK